MHRNLILALITILATPIARGQAKDSCFDKATQSELNACEAEQYRKVDAEMQRVYTQVLAKYSADRPLAENLRIAQEAWLKFRDAHMDSLFPETDKQRTYGSVYPMCKAIEMTLLTSQRTESLQRMLNPEEGDVCAFSAGDGSAQITGENRKLVGVASDQKRVPLLHCVVQSGSQQQRRRLSGQVANSLRR